MKRNIFLLLITILFASFAKAQYVSLPDSNFRNSIRTQWPGAFNAAGDMDTTYPQIVTVNLLNISGAGIKDITGVKYFKSITNLQCSGNQMTNLPELPATLTDLFCSDNQFSSIPDNLPASLATLSIYNNQITVVHSLPPALKYFIINNNPITIIDSLPTGLLTLSCGYTSLTTLPKLPVTLETLTCNNNDLDSLPALPPMLNEINCSFDLLFTLPALPANLKYLYCRNNSLTSLPTLPATLRNLQCYSNSLTALPALPDTLELLSCGTNSITTLPTLPLTIQGLLCSDNQITQLPALPFSLDYIDCSTNLLDSLPLLPNALTILYTSNNSLHKLPQLPQTLRNLVCTSNQIDSLPTLPDSLRVLNMVYNNLNSLPALPAYLTEMEVDFNKLNAIPELPQFMQTLSVQGNVNLGCLPFLPQSLTYLSLYSSAISCLPNIPPNCTPQPFTPTCNPTNNIHQCQSFPQIYGFIFNDNNSNGIYDTGDNPRRNIRTELNTGLYAYSNDNGYFNITADTLGSYTISITPPPFYSPVPLGNVHSFTSYTDVAYDTFALQPLFVKDSLAIHITPTQLRARPGFPFSYHVQGENTGTSTQTAAIKMQYDTTRLMFDSASAAGINVSGNWLVLDSAAMVPGQLRTFLAYFHVKPAAVIGDSLKGYARAESPMVVKADTSISPISGSYDPNSKQATPNLTPTQLMSGDFVEYLIHFQNTGTDTAFNIVIADTLSPKLRTNFLQMLGTSHPCRTTLGGGVVTFEFLGINLPDSNSNAVKSNGFIHFRIRPDSTLQVGDIIPNKASIYFDYNPPFVTNTCETHIQVTLLPLTLLNYQAVLQNEQQVFNSWTTTGQLNTSYFNIQRSADGRHFSTIGTIRARPGTGLQTYIYTDERPFEMPSFNGGGRLFYRLEIKNKEGSDQYSEIEVVSRNPKNGISFYPNPAKDILIVEGKAMQSILIMDNAGRKVLAQLPQGRTTVQLNIANLPGGIYLMQVTELDGRIENNKLLIK